jgi:nucleolar protein 53
LTKTRDLIKVPAVTEPHQGSSYNPPADAHRELLLRAAALEEKRILDVEKMAEVKAKIDTARFTADVGETIFAAGMVVQKLDDHDGEEIAECGSFERKATSVRRSRSQRNKETRLLAEVCSCIGSSATFF